MILLVIMCALLPCSVRLSAQGFSTSRVESTTNAPLVIAQRAPVGMPIRVLTGAGGSIRALEVDGAGGTWLRGPVSIGQYTGATSNELLRIASLPPLGGVGLVISMLGSTTSSGLSITDVGLTGSDHAGLLISSQANGSGTGIRIGGSTGTLRPTLATGIDITGGTGLRYNALSSGTGTAIDIGGTQPPRRGIEVTVSGTDNVGLIAHANTIGTGIIGSSRSLSYPTVGPYPRVGVVGLGATNSSVGSDSCTGVVGIALRGGTAGASTISIGVHGQADARPGMSTGTTIGVLGRSYASSTSSTLAIGGLFRSPLHSYALVAEGDVYLGSSSDARPRELDKLGLAAASTGSTTHVFDLNASGRVRMQTVCMIDAPNEQAVLQAGTIVACVTHATQRLRGIQGARITGITPEDQGRIVQLCNVGVDDLLLVHADPATPAQSQFVLPRSADGVLVSDTCSWFWYDNVAQGWRRIQ